MMSSYEIVCVIITTVTDMAAGCFATFICWCVVEFPGFRNQILESAQDGDKVTHWSDGKNVVLLILGLFSGFATFNIMMIFILFKMFDVGPSATVAFMTTVTGAFLGVSLHKKT